MFGLTTMRRLRAEVAVVKADRERIRSERDEFEENCNAAQAAAKTAARQFAEADAANRRLHGRNLELGQRVSQLAESDPEYAAQLERQVADLQKRLDVANSRPTDSHWRAEARRERDRADRLQKRLDDAVGLAPGGILNSAPWQPGYQAGTP